jgi:methionine-rich copper-binding protein CopC
MTPGEDNSGIGTNTRLTATFSEAMVAAAITEINPATGNPANFRLTDGSMTDGTINYISGTVSYDATNHVAVFTPAAELAANKRYTATIITGIKDPAGNPFTTDFAWCFVTGGTADGTAPSVTSTLPANAATGVAVNRKISATFDEAVNTSTITPARFKVTGPGSTPVSGSVTYLGRTAVFTPSNGLASNRTYTATITTGVMDLAGNETQADVAWSFTTGSNADVTAPLVISTDPANAASNVAISSTINVTFNEPMNPVTITTANFRVTGPGTTPVTGTVAFDTATNTATFTRINHLTTPVSFHPAPVSELEPGTNYTATLATGARDMAGNALASNLVWSFTTAP